MRVGIIAATGCLLALVAFGFVVLGVPPNVHGAPDPLAHARPLDAMTAQYWSGGVGIAADLLLILGGWQMAGWLNLQKNVRGAAGWTLVALAHLLFLGVDGIAAAGRLVPMAAHEGMHHDNVAETGRVLFAIATMMTAAGWGLAFGADRKRQRPVMPRWANVTGMALAFLAFFGAIGALVLLGELVPLYGAVPPLLLLAAWSAWKSGPASS